MKAFVSIIIPIRNEANYIKQVLESIQTQDYGKENFEIIIVDGQSTDNTVEVIKEVQKNEAFIFLYTNPNKITPFALNIAIQNSKGEIIVRMDAHSTYPNNYISKLVEYSILLNADNIGGVFDTHPANNSTLALAISECIKHPFSVGNSYHRIGKAEISEVDTVPYGCFKRKLFNKIGMFDTDLVRNQDDEFNARIIKNGGRIFIIPDLKIKYHARDRVKKVRLMFYQYGLYKPLVNKKIGSITSIRQLIPVIFLAGLFIGFVLAFLNNFFAYTYIATLCLYFATLVVIAFKTLFKTKKNHLLLLYFVPTIIFQIHLSYGLGYLIGLTNLNNKKFWNKKSNTNTNR